MLFVTLFRHLFMWGRYYLRCRRAKYRHTAYVACRISRGATSFVVGGRCITILLPSLTALTGGSTSFVLGLGIGILFSSLVVFPGALLALFSAGDVWPFHVRHELQFQRTQSAGISAADIS